MANHRNTLPFLGRDVFDFVQYAQSAVAVFTFGSRLDQISQVSSLLDAIPRCSRDRERYIVISVLHRFAVELHGGRPPRTSERALTRRRLVVHGALGYMQRHIADRSLSLKETAVHVSLTHAYLSRSMRLETGHGFGEHLRALRIMRALMLFLQVYNSVKEIATLAGFSSTSEMDRQFHRVLHLRPSECRPIIGTHTLR